VRPITFWGIVSFRRALPVCKADVSSALRTVLCLLALFLAAAGIIGQRQGRCIYIIALLPRRKARTLLILRGFAAACLRFPPRQARISAPHSSPRCITSWHLYIYYKINTVVVYISCGYPLLRDLRVLCDLCTKALTYPNSSPKSAKGGRSPVLPCHTTVHAGPHTAVQRVEPSRAGGSSRRSPQGLRRSAGFRSGFTVF